MPARIGTIVAYAGRLCRVAWDGRRYVLVPIAAGTAFASGFVAQTGVGDRQLIPCVDAHTLNDVGYELANLSTGGYGSVVGLSTVGPALTRLPSTSTI